MEEKKFCLSTFFAIAATALVLLLVVALLWREPPQGSREIVSMLVGVIIGKWGTIADFLFGSSDHGHKVSDALIEKKGEDKPVG